MSDDVAQIKPHIEKIREHLWSGKVLGRASVMVGAGFSRNAEKLSQRGPEMLSWADLATKIYDELYPDEASNVKKQTAIAGTGALRLVQEYKVTYGQNALDALIRASLPDEAYKPDLLHRYLLELPWSDVFTTNYDTLLEKASTLVFDRKYDVVLTSKDIASATRPRIVKLHGSFPSYRPYILTEEDFRTYPERFAPFVNAVQQSMMENIFCLIGFSGDDPNFQYWSGWVRDNLGEVTPKIYLTGLLDLSKLKTSAFT